MTLRFFCKEFIEVLFLVTGMVANKRSSAAECPRSAALAGSIMQKRMFLFYKFLLCMPSNIEHSHQPEMMQVIARACYDADKDLTARWLTFPLSFERFHDETIDINSRENQVENAVLLMLGLSDASEGFVEFLPQIFNYSVLFFPTSTRFGGSSGTGKEGLEIQPRKIRRSAISNTTSQYDSFVLSAQNGWFAKGKESLIDETNELLAMLRCSMIRNTSYSTGLRMLGIYLNRKISKIKEEWLSQMRWRLQVFR